MHEQASIIAGETKKRVKRKTQLETICRIIFIFKWLDAIPTKWFSRRQLRILLAIAIDEIKVGGKQVNLK
jgi:hypothetical protein